MINHWRSWLLRTFAHAFVRRLAALVVLLLLGWMGIGQAHATKCGLPNLYAQMGVPPASGATLPNLQAAVDRCKQLPAFMTRDPMGGGWYSTVYLVTCQKRADSNTVDAIFANGPWVADGVCNQGSPDGTRQALAVWFASAGCPNGTVWNAATGTCEIPCNQRPTKYHSAMKVATAMQCDSGCVYIYTIDPANPSGRIGTPQSGTCDVGDFSCPSGWVEGSGVHTSTQSQICTLDPNNDPGPDEKPDECPAGSSVDSSGACKPDSNTCPAGKTKGPDGSCIDSTCPAGQVKGPDGSCKKDGNGDGQPDADDGTFSGGDDCNTPPQCSGDAIACGQSRIQWRIECNTRKNRNVSGGACSAMPICSGEKCDALEYSSLLMQWRSACALEALAKGSVAGPGAGPGGGVFVGGGGGSGDGDTLGGIKDFLDGKGQGLSDAPAMPFVDGTADGESWSSGLGSGTCPAPVVTSVAFMGATFPIEFGFDFMCQFAAYIYWLVMGAVGVSSAFIIAGVRR